MLLLFAVNRVFIRSNVYFINLLSDFDVFDAPIEKVIVSDTIAMSKDKIFNKLEVISVSKIFAETIKRINKLTKTLKP